MLAQQRRAKQLSRISTESALRSRQAVKGVFAAWNYFPSTIT